MYETTERAPAPVPPAIQPVNYAIPLRWILSHILLLSPGFIFFIWASTLWPSTPTACLALPFIILAAFAAQMIGIAKVFQKPVEYLFWIVAFGIGFAIIFYTLFFNGVMGGSKVFQAPWGIAFVGGILGLLESLVLRPSYKRAWWWIPANAAGLMLGTLATTQLLTSVRSLCAFDATTNSQCGYSPFVLPVVTGVAIFSIITGATLIWIARREANTPAPLSRPDLMEAARAAGAFVLVLLGSVLLTQFTFIPQQAAEQAVKHKANTYLTDIDMVSPQEGWAVGFDNGDSSGVMFHYTGGVWTEVELPGSQRIPPLDSISMISPDDGWAVGGSIMLHYTNGGWTKAALPAGMGSSASITGVEMLGPSDGWAITYDSYAKPPLLTGMLLHYNGVQWDYVQAGTETAFFRDLSFSSPDDGWVVGYNPTSTGVDVITLHYTGGEWQNVESQMSVVPNTITMLSPDDGWAVAADHKAGTTIFHYTGGKWSTSAFFSDLNLPVLMIFSPTEGLAIGHIDKDGPTVTAMAHYDGTRWARTTDGVTIPDIRDLSMITSDEGWAVGGSTFYHYRNGTWTPYTQP